MRCVRQLLVFLLTILLSVSLFSQGVMAAAFIGDPKVGYGNFACGTTAANSDDVTAGGLFNPNMIFTGGDATDPCGARINPEKIFSSIGCRFILILNDVFGKFYCSLQFMMKYVLFAVATLYIMTFGAKVMMGMERIGRGAVVMALVKMGVVYMFATQGFEGVGYLYRFFIGLITETVDWVISAINCTTVICGTTTSNNISAIFSTVDTKVYTLLMGETDTSVVPNVVVCRGLFSENGEILLFLLMLFYFSIPLFGFAISLIKSTITIFASAVVSFVMSIVAVAFLISLSPIFLSFMLFNSTYSLFDGWVRFLVSYSLQPFIVFSMFSFFVLIVSDFLGFVNQISNVMTVVPSDQDKGGVYTVFDSLGFCPLWYGDTTTTIAASPVTPFIMVVPAAPKIACCTPVGDPPVCSTDPAEPSPPEDISLIPQARLLSPMNMMKDSKFIYFLAFHFLSLFVISTAFRTLIKMTPQLVHALTRSNSQMPLGAGFRSELGSIIHGASGSIGGAGRNATRKFKENSSGLLGR